MKSIIYFLLGIIVGVGALWGVLHLQPGGGIAERLPGTWTGSAQVAGTSVDLSLTIQKKGDGLTGQLAATPGGNASFDNMKIDPAGNFSFSIQVSGEAVTFSGKVVPDAQSMAGKLSVPGYGDGTWSLTKKS